uniref:Ribosomal_L7Ae domain-containing protein n=1 Tax=Rhabditophanes sp. KR3021 TaxID=114890 RepID=A0AC35TUT6_9BILA
MGKLRKVEKKRIELNSAIGFNWNIDANNSEVFLDELSVFLEKNGFKKDGGKITKDKVLTEKKEKLKPYNIRTPIANIGLKKTLKLLEAGKLKAMLFDAKLIEHQAIASVFGIKFKLNEEGATPVYCVPNLSSYLAKKLNYGNVSAVGLLTDCMGTFEIEKHCLRAAESIGKHQISTTTVLPKSKPNKKQKGKKK